MTSPRYLLDTNICIFIRQGRRQTVLQRFHAVAPEETAISVVTYGELYYGAEKSQHREAAQRVLKELLRSIEVLPLPREAGRIYGTFRAILERQGKVISNNDLWIAAHAQAAGLTFVTNNVREFGRLPSLVVEDWVN